MKSNEFRLGNCIYDNINKRTGKVFRLNYGIDYPITYSYDKTLEFSPKKAAGICGVLLTEKITLSIGFTIIYDQNNKYGGERLVNFDDLLEIWHTGQVFINHHLIAQNIKYVHQLQNIYFSLMGEDLIINN